LKNDCLYSGDGTRDVDDLLRILRPGMGAAKGLLVRGYHGQPAAIFDAKAPQNLSEETDRGFAAVAVH
jgi:hypothetical protein